MADPVSDFHILTRSFTTGVILILAATPNKLVASSIVRPTNIVQRKINMKIMKTARRKRKRRGEKGRERMQRRKARIVKR